MYYMNILLMKNELSKIRVNGVIIQKSALCMMYNK